MKKIAIFVFCLALGAAQARPTASMLAAPIGLPLVDLQQYSGTYKVSDLPFEKVVVSVKENKLHYVAGEYEGDFAEVSGKPDTYNANNGSAIVTFVRDAAGKVAKIKLEIDGTTYEGSKEQTLLTDYIGTYKVSGLPFEQVTLSVKNEQLHVVAGDNEGNLTPIANQPDAFDAAGQATIKFQRDEQKKVVKMLLEAQGQVFEGTPVQK